MTSETTNVQDVRAVVDAYFDGINGERYAEVGRLFADDAALIAPGIAPRIGPQQIAEYFGRALARYPVHYDDPTRVVIAGRTATVEISYTGELASGAPIAFEALDVFDFDEQGRIVRLVTAYDSHLVRSLLADAEAMEPPAPGAGGGSLAQATPARTRRALREVRRGNGISLGAGARWRSPLAGPLAARAVLVDVPAGAELSGPPAGDGAGAAPGDVLLMRSGGASVSLGAAAMDGLAAVATDGTFSGAPADLAVGEGWDLEALHAALSAAGRRHGLLVSVPGADGAANAAVWI